MKKLLSLILMLAVTLLPVSALAASGDAILLRQGEDGYNSSVFSIAEVEGDALRAHLRRPLCLRQRRNKACPL